MVLALRCSKGQPFWINQVVKHTAMACGIVTTTVSRLHKDFQGHEGLLPSPEKRYVES